MSARSAGVFQGHLRDAVENARLFRAIGLTLSVFMLGAAEANAARLVRASVSVDGKVVLKSSFGDDGSPDADEVWDQLKTLTFETTEDFASLGIDADAGEAMLESKAPVGKPGQILIDVSYGGTGETRHLRLVRGRPDRHGRVWRIDPEEIDRLFDERMIRRDEAARLKKVTASEADRKRASTLR